MRTEGWPAVLTVAGSDPCGGAGIQADLAALRDLSCHGMTAITAITVQTRQQVRRVDPLSPELVRDQLQAAWDDAPLAAIKTGMLATRAVVEVVADFVAAHPLPLVVDPVMISSSGRRLLAEDAVEVLRERLIPQATVVTPNAQEAEVLGALGVARLLTGGDAEGDEVIDLLQWPDGRAQRFVHRRVAGTQHGTGCTLSAALAAGLAKGLALEPAVASATGYVVQRLGEAATARGA